MSQTSDDLFLGTDETGVAGPLTSEEISPADAAAATVDALGQAVGAVGRALGEVLGSAPTQPPEPSPAPVPEPEPEPEFPMVVEYDSPTTD